MTKQDFEALAALIKAQRRTPESWSWPRKQAVGWALDDLARDMAQYMSRYPAFDEARFLAAAGVT